MKKIVLTLILTTILLLSHNIFGQSNDVLQFTDGSKLPVLNNLSENIKEIEIFEKEVIATFNSIGKGPLSKEIVNKVKGKNRKLFYQLRKINTAYQLAQDNQQFYISGFDSIDYEKLRDCNKCKIRCKLIILEIKSSDQKYYIPVIKSIKKIAS